ncbi:MAG: hypothetical protein RLZZ28_453, partial [Bacteroidota bacterium]
LSATTVKTGNLTGLTNLTATGTISAATISGTLSSGALNSITSTNLTTQEVYLGSNVSVTANAYATVLTTTLAAGTWLVQADVQFNNLNATQGYNEFTAVLGTASNAAYTSGQATVRNKAAAGNAAYHMNLAKIVTLPSSTTVGLYATSDLATTTVLATPVTNASTAGTATSIHALKIK